MNSELRVRRVDCFPASPCLNPDRACGGRGLLRLQRNRLGQVSGSPSTFSSLHTAGSEPEPGAGRLAEAVLWPQCDAWQGRSFGCPHGTQPNADTSSRQIVPLDTRTSVCRRVARGKLASEINVPCPFIAIDEASRVSTGCHYGAQRSQISLWDSTEGHPSERLPAGPRSASVTLKGIARTPSASREQLSGGWGLFQIIREGNEPPICVLGFLLTCPHRSS
jgi:hypothetical protein